MTTGLQTIRCFCNRCATKTTHAVGTDHDIVCCWVCGDKRWHWNDGGDYPELTFAENQIVHEARAKGFCTFYSAVPSAKAQAINTFLGASVFLKQKASAV